MSEARTLPRLGLMLLVGLSVGWGLNWPVLKIALTEIPPWTLRSGSCVIAGLCLLALARLSGAPLRPAAGEWRKVAISALFNIAVWQMLIAFAVMLMPSGRAAVIGFTMPLWATLIGVMLFGEKITGDFALALALGIGGILVLLSRDLATLGGSPLGVLLALGASVAWACGTVYQKRQNWTLRTIPLAGWQLIIGSVPIMFATPFLERPFTGPVSWLALLAFAYLTLVALVFAYFAWLKIVALFPPGIPAIGTLLVPVIGVISGALILGEPFGWREIAALLLVSAALTLVLIVPAIRARPPALAE
ncbi:MAG: DMT family transporter [Rhodospirillales bacterium]|nr:DMT family transporter [Rhodospirillales bacterium]